MKFYDFTLSTGAAYIPGTIEAEDLEADDYRYQDRGAWERNSRSYRDDVEVAIDSPLRRLAYRLHILRRLL